AVTMISAADGERFDAQAGVPLSARAEDSDDEIVSIAFYRDDVLIAESPGAIFNGIWSNPPPGNFVISAAATDQHGHTGFAGRTVAILVGADHDLPSLTVLDAEGMEGPTGTSNVIFSLQLSSPSAETVRVEYETIDGTATTPADYVATAGTATFEPGGTNLSLAVAIQDDWIPENT